MTPGRKGRHRLALAAGVACLLLARGLELAALLEGRRLLEQRTEVTALRLDAALQTFRPAAHRGLATPLGPAELADDRSVRTEPRRCRPLTLLATGPVLDGRSWTGGAGSPLQPVTTLTVRYADPAAARHDLLVKRAALLGCRTLRLTFPPFDHPPQGFTVIAASGLRPSLPDRLRYAVQGGGSTYHFYVRRYANTLTWSYADDTSRRPAREQVVDDLVGRLRELERQ